MRQLSFVESIRSPTPKIGKKKNKNNLFPLIQRHNVALKRHHLNLLSQSAPCGGLSCVPNFVANGKYFRTGQKDRGACQQARRTPWDLWHGAREGARASGPGPGETTETPSGQEEGKTNRRRCTLNEMRYDALCLPPSPQPFSAEADHPATTN